jgi:hypothetical protein
MDDRGDGAPLRCDETTPGCLHGGPAKLNQAVTAGCLSREFTSDIVSCSSAQDFPKNTRTVYRFAQVGWTADAAGETIAFGFLTQATKPAIAPKNPRRLI